MRLVKNISILMALSLTVMAGGCKKDEPIPPNVTSSLNIDSSVEDGNSMVNQCSYNYSPFSDSNEVTELEFIDGWTMLYDDDTDTEYLINDQGRPCISTNFITRTVSGYYIASGIHTIVFDPLGNKIFTLIEHDEGIDRKIIDIILDESKPYIIVQETIQALEGQKISTAIYDTDHKKVLDIGYEYAQHLGENYLYAGGIIYKFNSSSKSLDVMFQAPFKYYIEGIYDKDDKDSCILAYYKESSILYLIDRNGKIVNEMDIEGALSVSNFSNGLFYCNRIFYDRDLNPIVDLSKYSEYRMEAISRIFTDTNHTTNNEFIFRNGFLAVNLQNKEYKYFNTIFDIHGNELYEPKPGLIYNKIVDSKYVTYDAGDNIVRCYQLDGALAWSTPGTVVCASDNNICINDGSEIKHFDWNGNVLYSGIAK